MAAIVMMRTKGIGRQVSVFFLVATAIVATVACIGGGDDEARLSRRLIFLPRSSGDYDIRLRTTNDRLPVELGRMLPWDSQPVWSPDGTRIAFYSDRNFNLPDRD